MYPGKQGLVVMWSYCQSESEGDNGFWGSTGRESYVLLALFFLISRSGNG